jgi:hypothetical protein
MPLSLSTKPVKLEIPTVPRQQLDAMPDPTNGADLEKAPLVIDTDDVVV